MADLPSYTQAQLDQMAANGINTQTGIFNGTNQSSNPATYTNLGGNTLDQNQAIAKGTTGGPFTPAVVAAQQQYGGNITKEMNDKLMSGQWTEQQYIDAVKGLPQMIPGGPIVNTGSGPQQVNSYNAATGQIVGTNGQVSQVPAPTGVPAPSPVGGTQGTTGTVAGATTAIQPLQPGATGDSVKALQDQLVKMGLMTQDQVNTGYGIYGPQTTAAVKKLQEQLGIDNSSGPGYFGPKTIAALQNPQNQAFLQANKSGEAPSSGGSSAAQSFLDNQPQPKASIFDGLMKGDQNFQAAVAQIQADYNAHFSSANQQQTLVQQYQQLQQQMGLPGINAELLNDKKILDGTEDDIRTEITKAGGFATESQVQALTMARNKTLLLNYNNLLATKNSIESQLNTIMGLSQQDRQAAQQQFSDKMNLDFQIANMAEKMQQNAVDQYNNLVKNVGYDGIFKMLGGDAHATSVVENALGITPGGLAKLAQQSAQERTTKQAGDLLDIQYKQAQIAKIESDIRTSGINGVDASQVLAYAQQYASTGQIPAGIPKGTFGLVSQAAKELPKSPGTLVDKNTGIKSSGTNDTLQGAYGNLYSVVTLASQLKELDQQRIGGVVAGTFGKIFGSSAQTNYMDLKSQIVDLLARARSGAALTATEEQRYSDMLPGRFSEPFFLGTDSSVKIDNFIKNITSDLNSKLNTQGLAIYGFSKVNINGQTYTVGDIVENTQKQQGRVNPDGSITLLQ